MEDSKIEWTDHTFNPWIGCTRVSPGCQHCYAETMMDEHWQKVKWGPAGQRVKTSEAYWKKPLKWNQEEWGLCVDCGYRGPHSTWLKHGDGTCKLGPGHPDFARQRVFCASLADVFEDNPQVVEWRKDLFTLMQKTPNLDWLILTKRPENIKQMVLASTPPTWDMANIWWGTSVENQKTADERVRELLKIPGPNVKFLSVEPMLGPVMLSIHTLGWKTGVHWVICGGESGVGCRPMEIAWANDLWAQCYSAGVPFFMKQLGGHPNKRHDLADFPEKLRVREFPEISTPSYKERERE